MSARLAGAACGAVAVLLSVAATPASARCTGTVDPVVAQLELQTGRNPAAAIDAIARRIARTDPDNTRRLAELYLVQSIAMSMSGTDPTPASQKAQRVASSLPDGDPVNLMLRMDDYSRTQAGPEKQGKLASVERDYRALPDGSDAKACLAIDLAYNHAVQENPRRAFVFASQAYRDSAGQEQSIVHAQAATMLAFLVSSGHDFEYAKSLNSEALKTYLALDLSDLAANELVLRGYTHLADGDWRRAIDDFEASAQQARSYGNEYAVDYAQLGVCQAALEGGAIDTAAPACEVAYRGLAKPDERMSFAATALMAQLRVEQGEERKALSLIDPLIAAGRGETPAEDWADALKTRAQALSALGRNAQAYADIRQANEVLEEYRRDELQSGVAALQARFQTEVLQKRLSAEERASEARLRLAIAVIVGSITALLLLGTLIFFLLRHRRRFRRLAMIDPLTGLSNRRAALEKAAEALRIVGSARPRASVALFDIDHFKSCNDRFGHAAGDRVLSEFARIVEDSVRPTDIVGRWGGEEFLVIFPATNAAQAARIIDRVRIRAEREAFDFAPDYRLRFSAGIAMLHETDDSMDDCVKLADKRLYAAKAQGRDRTCASGHADDPGLPPAPVPEPVEPAQSRAARAA